MGSLATFLIVSNEVLGKGTDHLKAFYHVVFKASSQRLVPCRMLSPSTIPTFRRSGSIQHQFPSEFVSLLAKPV